VASDLRRSDRNTVDDSRVIVLMQNEPANGARRLIGFRGYVAGNTLVAIPDQAQVTLPKESTSE